MCFDLTDKKGMQWSIPIGSCAYMRIVRELWQDFSGLICLQELCLIYRIVWILVFEMSSGTPSMVLAPKYIVHNLENTHNSCFYMNDMMHKM